MKKPVKEFYRLFHVVSVILFLGTVVELSSSASINNGLDL